jgi:ATP adenylyltransferase
MMIDADILLRPGTLADQVDARTCAALATGALQPIETDRTVIEDAGVRFLVRVVSNLRRKEAESRLRSAQGADPRKPVNPFFPPEAELTVCDISLTHLAVLNKFNVLERHLLIVTRAFEHQETFLTVEDFRALFTCMAEYDSLGFYNGGVIAGASQTHKHLQLVPLPAEGGAPAIPMETLLVGPGPRCPRLPFAHAFGRLVASIPAAPLAAAAEAHELYQYLLLSLGVSGLTRDGEEHQSAPYNLLVAHDWMLLVPRIEEFFRSVSVNALGFAGSLFVKEQEQLKTIRSIGPMRVLAAVAGRSH